jgi:hypothetical protein
MERLGAGASRLLWAAALFAAMLVVVGCTAELLAWDGFPAKFRLDRELAFPAWYASILMAATGGLAWWVGAVEAGLERRSAIGWRLLGILFVYFSADEMVGIHERIADGLGSLPNPGGLLTFRWVVVGIPLVALAGALFLPFLRRLPRRTAVALVIAGLVFVVGAIGMEMLGGAAYTLAGRKRTVLYIALMTMEEALEYLGVLLAMRAMLKHVAGLVPTLQPFATSAANASNSGRRSAGWPGKLGTPGSIATQGAALEVQILPTGTAQLMSSSVPGRTTRYCGDASGTFHSFVPHWLQAIMRTVRPLSASLSVPSGSPAMSSRSSAWTIIDSVWVVPEKRWQSLQWHA